MKMFPMEILTLSGRILIMKFMKKFSLIVALALLVTVGGVYAQWVYDSNVITTPSTANLLPKLAGSTADTPKGTINVDTTGVTKLLVDESNLETHIAKFVVEGDVVVRFTPGDKASGDVQANGIRMKYWFTIDFNTGVTEDQWKYPDKYGNDQPIFVVDGGVFEASDGAATKEFTITAEELMQKINLGGEFYLDTLDDYNAFNGVIGKAYITIHVCEAV